MTWSLVGVPDDNDRETLAEQTAHFIARKQK
jgi:hypothetical protein